MNIKQALCTFESTFRPLPEEMTIFTHIELQQKG
jgi:hypothetical protein